MHMRKTTLPAAFLALSIASWAAMPPRVDPDSDGSRALTNCLSALADAAKEPGGRAGAAPPALEALHFMVSFDRLIRPYFRESKLLGSKGPGTVAERITRDAMAWLETHYMEQVSVDDCARAIAVSRSTLSHSFRTVSGQSIPRALNDIRLRHARALLVSTDLEIIEVAMECGFNDQAWFSRQFKALTGLAPSLWRISAEYVKVGGMTVNLTGSCSCFTLLGCALAVNACGMELDEQFRAPPPNAARPCIALAADREGLLGEGVGRQLERARDIGAGGVLLAVPTADEAVWEGVTRALDRARQLGLEAGLTDFFISQNEAESAPRAKKWVWSAETVRPDSDGVSRMTPRVATPPDSYRSVTCQAVPVGVTDLHPHHLVDLSAQSLPTGGVWRVYRFGVVDAEPPQIDPYDGTALFRHVNQWLFACQSRMKQTYGSTLLWVLLPGLSRTDMAWTVDLPEMFLKRSGLGLNRYLPAWTGVAVGMAGRR